MAGTASILHRDHFYCFKLQSVTICLKWHVSLHLGSCSDRIHNYQELRCSEVNLLALGLICSLATYSPFRGLQLTQLGAMPKLFTRDNCWSCAGLIETRCTIVVHLFVKSSFQFKNSYRKTKMRLAYYLNSKWAICMPDPMFSFLGMTWSTIGPSAGCVNWRAHAR